MSDLVAPQTIAIRVTSIDEVFDPRDPAAITTRMVQQDFIEYVLIRVARINKQAPIKLEISGLSENRTELPTVLKNRLLEEVVEVDRELRHHFKDARKVLAIAFAIMLACVIVFKVTELLPLPGA